jgi:hypothetical protein
MKLLNSFRALLVFSAATSLTAQVPYTAYDLAAPTNGNQAVKNLTVGNDFYVVRPITVGSLGVFDDRGDGIQGEAVLAVQLFARNGNDGTLLETLTFDATSPGTLTGGHRFKRLPAPVTLLPGAYTIAARGFDDLNREGNAGNRPYVSNPPPWQVNDGGGLLRFEGGARHGYQGPNQFPNQPEGGPVNRYAAGAFTFAAASLPVAPHAADYAALVAGVEHFPADCCLGSVAVFGRGAFPVLAEPGGRRLVIAAAGTYEGRAEGARCVAFAHTQFATATDEARARLWDNAILWAGRQGARERTVVGVGPGVDAARLAAWGYVVKPVTTDLATADTDLGGCQVFVADWHCGDTSDVPQTRYTPEAVAQIAVFNAAGGGLVMAATPWAISYMVEQPEFVSARQLLHPFGLAYRDSQVQPADGGFTNIAAQPWPAHLSAFPAADLLRAERAGAIRLSGYDKFTALGAINYTLSARPDLLCELTATCLGQPYVPGPGIPAGFVDLLSLSGAQAATNWLGSWAAVGDTLEARGRRGAVAYAFELPAGDIYRLSVEGGNLVFTEAPAEMPLWVSVDGVPVGRVTLVSSNGANSRVECLLPWLPAGPHSVRLYWDNAANLRSLRLTRVTLQTGLGGDSDGDGTKDWVAVSLRAQSGLDNTNAAIGSYTSPACVEGRDPYLPALRCWLGSPGSEPRLLRPQLAPDRRWFADVPLVQDPTKRVTLEVSYQNGGRTETRQLQWLPLDLLTASDLTIRQGDSLLLTVGTAPKSRGEMVLTVGTNQLPDLDGLPVPHSFNAPGQYTVTGAWSPAGGVAQSRSITVRVVGFRFPDEPLCWVGRVREWDVTNMPPELVLELDGRLLATELAVLPGNGRRLGLLIDEAGPGAVLARLGAGGPVLHAMAAQGVNIDSGAQTYTQVLAVYPDGSQLVETLIVAPLLPPGASLKLSLFVGGVLFEDGTTEKWLTAADFDALGQCRVRFVKAPGVLTSNCHSLELYQAGENVGRR